VAKGFLEIKGYKIISAKVILLKFQNLEYNIIEGDPFIIKQKQNSHHILDFLIKKFKNFEEDFFQNSSIEEILNILEECMTVIQNCREKLEYDSIFQTKLYSTIISTIQSVINYFNKVLSS
jgi:type IV secretory pathway VirB4 component